jgi:hypothetical protein
MYVQHNVRVTIEELTVGLRVDRHHLEVLNAPDEQTESLASLVPLFGPDCQPGC